MMKYQYRGPHSDTTSLLYQGKSGLGSIKVGAPLIDSRASTNPKTTNLIVQQGFNRKPRQITTECIQPPVLLLTLRPATVLRQRYHRNSTPRVCCEH